MCIGTVRTQQWNMLVLFSTSKLVFFYNSHTPCWPAGRRSQSLFYIYNICTAAPSAPAASGDGFMSGFPMDSQEESDLLNNRSDFSRRFEDDAKAEVREEMAEDAAEAGVVPGGDGDGNALIVRGGRRKGRH